MKKDKKPGSKQKEFASRPFAPLKGVRAEPQVEPRRAQPPPPEPELPADDAELFLRAVADARRLSPAPAAAEREKPAPPRPPSRLDEEERHLFIDALKDLQLDISFRDELPGQEEPARPLPVNRLRQLRRGAIRLDLQLDLHGLTRDEALKSLAAFITSAHNRGQKAVLVITGKGNRSPGEPVLQGAVTGWLRERGKGMVAEFAPAPREMGGGGAFVVFLKGKEKDGAGE
ncbi:MAG: Smr/MutS family protein [Geobacteraceae bacterium]|nr:Smr/MutS family protein [Geobacteraceae bacterium]